MPRFLLLSSVQLDARPSPLADRLPRAERLIAQAARQGAQLIVLPEVFNTGYEYSDDNYARAESIDGMTAQWMKTAAARYRVHLAGTFLRREQNKIFNTMLLVSPGGRAWGYDKNYPWIWERAYFQGGNDITVADTGIGKIGMLICWDVAHTDLWRKYAGKADLMIVSSCPPKPFDMTLTFPNGARLSANETGLLIRKLKNAADPTFGFYLRRQAQYLGVPVAHAAGTGTFSSRIPFSKISLSALGLIAPRLWKYRRQFDEARIETTYFNDTYVADAAGNVLGQVPPNEEGFAIGEVTLGDKPPRPSVKQPPFGVPKSSYIIDPLAEILFANLYKTKARLD
jgi:predicted amidohydrolase